MEIAPNPMQVAVTKKNPNKIVFFVPRVFLIVVLNGAKII